MAGVVPSAAWSAQQGGDRAPERDGREDLRRQALAAMSRLALEVGDAAQLYDAVAAALRRHSATAAALQPSAALAIECSLSALKAIPGFRSQGRAFPPKGGFPTLLLQQLGPYLVACHCHLDLALETAARRLALQCLIQVLVSPNVWDHLGPVADNRPGRGMSQGSSRRAKADAGSRGPPLGAVPELEDETGSSAFGESESATAREPATANGRTSSLRGAPDERTALSMLSIAFALACEADAGPRELEGASWLAAAASTCDKPNVQLQVRGFSLRSCTKRLPLLSHPQLARLLLALRALCLLDEASSWTSVRLAASLLLSDCMLRQLAASAACPNLRQMLVPGPGLEQCVGPEMRQGVHGLRGWSVLIAQSDALSVTSDAEARARVGVKVFVSGHAEWATAFVAALLAVS